MLKRMLLAGRCYIQGFILLFACITVLATLPEPLCEMSLFYTNPEAYSHGYYLDGAGESFNPLETKCLSYSFFNHGWMEASSFKFKQGLFLSDDFKDKDWSSFWYGLSYLRFGNIKGLLREINDPYILTSPWARLWYGLALYENGDIDSAITVLSDLKDIDDAQIIMALQSKYLLGLCYLDKNKIDVAVSLFDELLEKYPESILSGEINYRLFRANLSKGDTSRALDNIRKSFLFFDNSERKQSYWWGADMLYSSGLMEYKAGEYDRSLNSLKKLITNYSDYNMIDQAKHLIGLCEISKEDAIKPEILISGNLSNESASDILFRMGYKCLLDSDYSKASSYFLESSGKATGDVQKEQSFFFLAESEFYKKDYEKAKQFYQLALKYSVNHSREDHWGIAWCYLNSRQYSSARQSFNEVLSNNSKDELAERALFQSAWSYYDEGNYRTSALSYETYLHKFKSSDLTDDANYFLILSLSKLNDKTVLPSKIDKFLRAYPYSPYAQRLSVLGIRVNYEAKEYEKGISLSDLLLRRELLSHQKDTILFYSELARYKTREYLSAKQLLESAFLKRPESQLWNNLFFAIGDSVKKQDGPLKALEFWDEARNIKAVSDTFWLYCTFGMIDCLVDMNDISYASKLVEQLIGEYPKSDNTRKSMERIADYYERLKDYVNEIQMLNRIVVMFPDPKTENATKLRLGKAYIKLRKYVEARAILATISKSMNNSENLWDESRVIVMESFLDEGKYQSAVEYYDSVYQSLGVAFRCSFKTNLAFANVKLGNSKTADSIYSGFSSHKDKDGCGLSPYDYYIWGESQAASKNFVKACSLFTLAITDEASDSTSRRARERLLEIRKAMEYREIKN
jgi:tetratricopeptide (TPR) repeat protein